jgi:hypothetical protein
LRLAGLVAYLAEKRVSYMVSVGKTKGTGRLENWTLMGNNIKKELERNGMESWTGLICLRIRTDCGLKQCGNKQFDSIKCAFLNLHEPL